MEYIELNNGVFMPMVGLGTWELTGDECIETIAKALQLGYRLIDTAQMYGNEKEVGLGILQSQIAREELFLTTKLYRVSNCYEKAKKAIDDSLRNLQVDYLDLLLLHEPYAQGLQMYRALEEAYQEGKVKAIGISNYSKERYEEFIRHCSIVPALNQVECHLLHQKEQLQEVMKAHGTIMQAWSPLAQGNHKILHHATLLSIAERHQKTAAQIALRFLLQRGISIIPKSKQEQRLSENIDLFDFTLSSEEMQELRRLDQHQTLFPWTENF